MDEKMKVLKLLEDGKISAEEATKLLDALKDNTDSTTRNNKNKYFTKELSYGFNTLSRVAKELFGPVVAEFGETLKDLPATIITPFRDFDYSREFTIKEMIKDEIMISVDGKVDSFKFLKSKDNELRVEGKIFVSSTDLNKSSKMPSLEFERSDRSIKLISTANSIDLYRIEATIYIPQDIKLVCNTKTGNIEVEGVTAIAELNAKLGKITMNNNSGDVTAMTKGGTINVKNHTGTINLDVKNGSLVADNIIGDSHLKCTNGLVELNNPVGLVDIEVSTGSIKVNFSKNISEDKHSIISKTGMIHLFFNEQSDAKVSAVTKLGSVIVDPVFKNRDGLVKIGEGGPEIVTETKIGTITISKLNEE